MTWERKSPSSATRRQRLTSGIFTRRGHPHQCAVAKLGVACGGDSGSAGLPSGTDDIVAVHTGGYRLGYNGVLCGRMTSLNHSTDIDGEHDVYSWILDNAF